MNAFQSIVVGIDFSDASIAAVHEALRLAAPGNATVTAVQVIEREIIEEQTRFHQIAAEQALSRIHTNLTKHLASHGAAAAEPRVVVGNPYHGIEETIRFTKADLLVLGSRGWDHHPGTVGTVASKAVRRAPLPVLLVRRQHTGPFRKIIACTDFSATARIAVERAGQLAAAEKASLDVIHVDYPAWLQPLHIQYDLQDAPKEDFRSEYHTTIQARLEQHVDEILAPCHHPAQCHVLEDIRAADAIARFIETHQADLVVLGTAGRTGLNAILLGTTAERLIYRTTCSVLAVKPPQVS